MTESERDVVLAALWRSVGDLIPKKSRDRYDELQLSIVTILNDFTAAWWKTGYDKATAELSEKYKTDLAAATTDAYRQGMIDVMKRSDFRDPDAIEDPQELRSEH